VRHWRLLGVAILLALFSGVGVQAWRSMVVPDLRTTVSPRAAPLGDTPSGAVLGTASQVSAAAQNPPPSKVGPVVALASAPAEASASLADREVVLDLCGVGPLRLKPPSAAEKRDSYEILPPSLGAYARSAAWPRVLAAMDAAPDERSHAAAMLLRYWGLLDAEASPAQLAQPAVDTSRWQRELALAARRSSDAAVLRWALVACGRTPSAAECHALSTKDLVRLAPDEGSHWLALASDSQASPQDQEAAFRRATTAARFSDMPSLALAVDKAFPADLPDYLRMELLVQTIGVEAAFPDNTMSGLVKWCRQPAGNERRAQCAALADALAERGQSLMALGMARSIGKKHGWPDTKVAAVAAEEAALMNTLSNATAPSNPNEVYACKNVQSMQRWAVSRATLGERAALKSWQTVK
jgi:hypothetical protein